MKRQNSGQKFVYSIVVCDNDSERSAKPVVDEFMGASMTNITYCVEPEQNIALARNRALAHASEEFIAFIDDDEFPDEDWLATLVSACERYHADGVLGPVRPHFDQPPPSWIIKGRFCERPEYATGLLLHWDQTRTGNALIKRHVLEGVAIPFRAEFGNGGEDQEFFRTMMERGYRFVWCNEAIVHEIVPPSRWTRRFMLKRGLLQGHNKRRLSPGRIAVKSAVALPLYVVTLPVAILVGEHVFMYYAIRLFYHAGLLLATCGIRPLGEKYL
jgi:cellulose synthase/poly-beta-1,6-N-acetylglucosamine synthase-like glycosyltransferase